MAEDDDGEDVPQPPSLQRGMVHTMVAVEPPIKVFRPPQLDSAKVRYDVCMNELVVVQGGNIQTSPLFTGPRGNGNDSVDFTVSDAGAAGVLAAKRSLAKSWLGVLKSEKELVFYRYRRATDGAGMHFTPVAAYSCKQAFQLGGFMRGGKRANVVVDFFWLSDNVVAILTSSAIETFSLEKNTLQRLRHYATPIDYYVFNSRHRVLLCVSRDKPGLLKTYKIGQTSGITRCSKISVPDAAAKEFAASAAREMTTLGGRTMPRYNLWVVRLYGRTCLLHITVQREMHLYTLTSKTSTWDKTQSFALPREDVYTVNIVDNLILVHMLNAKETVVYDHRLSTSPIVPPQTMGFSFTGDASRLYDGDAVAWVHPDKIVDLERGGVYALVFDARVAVPKLTGNTFILSFLLQRHLSKQEVLTHLRRCCLNPNISLSDFASMFDHITEAMARGIDEDSGNARLTSGFLTQPSSRSFASPSFAQNPSFCMDVSQSPSPDAAAARASPTASGSDSVVSPQSAKKEDGDSGSETGEPGLTANNSCKTISTAVATPALHRATPPSSGTALIRCFENAASHRLNETGTTVPYPYYSSAGEWYTMSHLLVIDQVDMYNDVFERVQELNARQKAPITHTRFRALFLEYTRSLMSHSIKLKNVLQEFLIDLLVKCDPPCYPKLHSYLQYRVIDDSVPIALYLMKFEDRYPPAFLLAVEMLGRLRAYHEMVKVLLAKGHLIRAVEIMTECRVEDVDVQYVLSKASTATDPLELNALRVLLKRYNKRVRDLDEFPQKERSQAFEEQYQKIVGIPCK